MVELSPEVHHQLLSALIRGVDSFWRGERGYHLRHVVNPNRPVFLHVRPGPLLAIGQISDQEHFEPPRVWYRPYFVCDAAGVAASVAA